MSEQNSGIQQPQVSIEKELRKSYLEYSLSVIIGRAIPDARDGLKPVHRRIMYAQYELANSYNRPHKKSARIVGDVIGKYHPHGDRAVYDALVRLAQDFSMRDPLVDGQGNFGSIDGDAAAAMRYTEVRMSRLASEFLADIDKETVDFRPNYDNTLQEPSVLPTKVPNLLLNGSSGIAVGMATNIPPHNLGELCDALQMLLDDPQCTISDLMEVVKGPDFPTRGFVYAGKGLSDAYHTGRGTVKVRGRLEVEERKKGLQAIVIREIPFGLNKSSLVEKIAGLVNDHKIDGISDLRDESDRKGIRVVIDLKRGTIPDIVINSLYKYTPLETSFGINMLAVVDNRPVLLNLKTALSCFVDHRREVVIRRTRYDLQKAEARAHILEGLRIAIDHIDEVVALIRASASPDEARAGLMQRFELTEVQARAILDMRLQRLTGLQREELMAEYRELLEKIEFFKSVLENPEVLRSELKREIREIRETFATPRRTEVLTDALGGIDVNSDVAFNTVGMEVPDEDGSGNFHFAAYSFQQGLNHLDGRQALAFARERDAFDDGDMQRGRNQMLVIQGIVNKAASPAILKSYQDVLAAASDSIATNMPKEDIISLVKMQLQDMSGWNITTYGLAGENSADYCYSLGNDARYAVVLPNERMVATAQDLIQQVLRGETPVVNP